VGVMGGGKPEGKGASGAGKKKKAGVARSRGDLDQRNCLQRTFRMDENLNAET